MKRKKLERRLAHFEKKKQETLEVATAKAEPAVSKEVVEPVPAVVSEVIEAPVVTAQAPKKRRRSWLKKETSEE